jgi:hypothetical protein
MEHHTRVAARFAVKVRLSDLYGSAFQDFFYDLMCKRYPDFIDVRTAGALGDIGSDGISLHTRKLYSCYGPETFDARNATKKIRDDLEKAHVKRPNAFSTFVFVHNDRRGLHPLVSAELSRLSDLNRNITFENFGTRRFCDEVCRLEQQEIEDLLGQPLPIQDLVYRVELDELAPLLEHLRRSAQTSGPSETITTVSQHKLAYNQFDEDTQEMLRNAIVRGGPLIDRYYRRAYAVTERDEVAAAFRAEFERVRTSTPNAHPDDILHQMEGYILGNLTPSFIDRRAAMAVLGYFFESCDIFDDAPANQA